MTSTRRALASLTLLICGFLGMSGSASADEATTTSINWTRLQLNPQQAQHIQSLENQWTRSYMDVQPSIVEDQRRLTRLMSDPNAHPAEIMALQQAISLKREQLRSNATANYLQKRQVLDQNQQHMLQDMMRQQVDMRQRQIRPSGFQPDVMPDKIQDLMRRVRGFIPGPGQ
jgi:hypothetical protein